jgi:hypothetical protein
VRAGINRAVAIARSINPFRLAGGVVEEDMLGLAEPLPVGVVDQVVEYRGDLVLGTRSLPFT